MGGGGGVGNRLQQQATGCEGDTHPGGEKQKKEKRKTTTRRTHAQSRVRTSLETQLVERLERRSHAHAPDNVSQGVFVRGCHLTALVGDTVQNVRRGRQRGVRRRRRWGEGAKAEVEKTAMRSVVRFSM